MASQNNKTSPDKEEEEFEEEEKETKMMPLYEIEGDVYQQFNKPVTDDWEMSLIWQRHTVSSKAKDWGTIKARQSRPIPALYQRTRLFDAVPAFKRYNKDELKSVLDRIQRPTKSALLRSSQRESAKSKPDDDEKKTDADATNRHQQQQLMIKRLLRPTESHSNRVELTRKYRPKTSTDQEEPPAELEKESPSS